MKVAVVAFAAVTLAALVLTGKSEAQPLPSEYPNVTFFVTSVSGPKGADYGGLAGADKHCQDLASKVGAGSKTWHAYLSTQAIGGAAAVNARDRIGKGPWVNVNGVQIAANVEDLHSNNNKINLENSLAENGRHIPGRFFVGTQHDVLTGSTEDGRALPPDKDATCGNWTKSGADGSAIVGHSDRLGLRDDAASHSWNSAHPSRGCNPEGLKSTGSAGLLYCFAVN
jgi:hypothetical protein